MKNGFFSYLRHSFAEKASALALATTMLAPFGAILGTPRPAQAAPPEVFFGGDYSNDVFNAKEDDNDIRAFFGANFSSPTHTHIAVIEGLPSNAILVSGGGILENGTWTRTVSGSSVMTNFPRFSLEESPDHSDLNRSLTFRIRQLDAAGNVVEDVPIQKTLKIDAVADTPDIAAFPTTGFSNQNVTLNVDAAPTDTDGSEVISLTLTGVPSGVSFVNGTLTNAAIGEWTFTDLPPVLAATGGPVDFTATGVATATETYLDDADDDTSDNTATSAPVAVQVTVTDPPPAPLACPGVALDTDSPDVSTGLKGIFRANLAAPGKEKANSLVFQLSIDAPTSALGDPLTESGTHYLICGYGPDLGLISGTVLKPGTIDARNKPNFKPTKTGFTYKDPKNEHGPVKAAMLKGNNAAGKGGLLKFTLKGEGADMPPQSGGPEWLDGRATIQITARHADGSQHTWHAILPDVRMDQSNTVKNTAKYAAQCNTQKGPPCLLPSP